MSGIGVVLNPRSRKNLKDPAAASRMARQLGDRGVVRTARSRDELSRIAEDFRKLKIDVLGISGGDGTNHVTLTGFLEVYADEPLPPIALLRGGTMNTVANAVGVPRGRPDGLLASLLRRYATRHEQPLETARRHVMRMQGEGAGHYGFIFGTGCIYGFIAEYYKSPEPDPVWAAKVLGRAIASAAIRGETAKRVGQRWQGKVTFDDGSGFPDADYLSVAAGTVDQIGLGFRPFHRYAEAPGRFHMLGIHTSAGGFIRRLPRIWRSEPMGESATYEHLATRAVLEARDGVVRYVCDGDVHEQRGPLAVSIGPLVDILIDHRPGSRPPLTARWAGSGSMDYPGVA